MFDWLHNLLSHVFAQYVELNNVSLPSTRGFFLDSIATIKLLQWLRHLRIANGLWIGSTCMPSPQDSNNG
jgi:hypothetical protein